jgi:FkbM family methyltransferase
VYDALKRSVKIGYVVLDIGANVGIYTMLMARWVGKEGRVFAFEPAAEAREALAQHLALNSLGDRVELVASAISDEVGEASFFVDGVCGENGLHPGFTGHGRRSSAISVPVTTIDAFCSRTGVKPSVIKVDIEGFELHAIRGAQEVISRCRPVLIVELHQYAWKELGQRWAETREFFGKLGYLCSPLGANPLSDGLGHVLLQSKFNV